MGSSGLLQLMGTIEALKRSLQEKDKTINDLTQRLECLDFAVSMYDSFLTDALNKHIEKYTEDIGDKYQEVVECMTTGTYEYEHEFALSIELKSETIREFNVPYRKRIFGRGISNDKERNLGLFYISRDAMPITKHVIPAAKEFFSQYLNFHVEELHFESYFDFEKSTYA